MTTLNAQQQAVLEAITLKGQVEALEEAVADADKQASLAVAEAAKERDSAVAKAREIAENAREEAEAQYVNAVTLSTQEPVAKRQRLREAQEVLARHLVEVQQEHGIRLDWLNRGATPGGRVSL